MIFFISIVIVNWNSGSQLYNCINSIDNTKKDNLKLEIIIVDNGSCDNSLDKICKSNFKEKLNIKIIKNNRNLGFAKACNIGAQQAKGDYLLFLNPDVVLFDDTFVNLFNFIKNHAFKNVGVYGVQLLNEKGEIQRTCSRFPSTWNLIITSLGLNKINHNLFKSILLEEWDHLETKEVTHVMGAFYLIKRKIFNRLMGFDERFFVYYEDLDLSKRIFDVGYRSLYVTEARAYHKGGGVSEQVKDKRLYYSLKSIILYSFKHLGILGGIVVLLMTYLIEPITRTVYLLGKKDFKGIVETSKGFWLLYKDTHKTLKTILENKSPFLDKI